MWDWRGAGLPCHKRGMRPHAFLIALFLLIAAAGCDRINQFAGGPTLTTVPDHLPPFTRPGTPIAVCYNKDTAKMEDLKTAALERCQEPGSTLEYLTGDEYINDCPLLTKRRAVFICREPAGLPQTKRQRPRRTDPYFPEKP
jgi:hypothetical protein